MRGQMSADSQTGGLLLVDKPGGMTSHDIVAGIRRHVRPLRVGHTGTLDPLATGLLILCVGEAVKISGFIEKEDKVYRGVALLGLQTDTQDVTGKVTARTAVENISEEQVRKIASRFIGEVEQRPPAFSAVKIGGVRAYKLARNSKPVEMKTRRVRITRFDIERVRLPRVDFVVECSKGTYIRALCNDLGAALGVGGCMESLRRLSIGQYTVDNAKAFAELNSREAVMQTLLPASEALSYTPAVVCGSEDARLIECGMPVIVSNDLEPVKNGDSLAHALGPDGELLAVGRLVKKGETLLFQPKRVLMTGRRR
ncbi:tRNA pseudouridine(55) synthase TruB [Candidatus Poribacteria bacterium]|nr:tRNA pseudouridine(55) synthase TruB [Candidatus Poribacteria bacterium]